VTDKKYKYWLSIVDGQLVQFSELPHMIAIALHPEGGMGYVSARINLEDELKKAVRDGLLRVRNPFGLGFHTLPNGNALQRAVLIPDTDLQQFLNEKGIELRITPHGNGPEYWTLENAAVAMQEQLNWHDGTRAEFLDQMQEAAQSSALVILDPRTCLPSIRIERVRTYWEYVTPESVNAWLAALKAPYRWSPAPPLVKVPQENTTPPAPVASLDGNAWINKTRERAAEIINRQRKLDLYPSQVNLGDEIAREFRCAGIVGADGKPLKGSYIKRHALNGISSAQGKQLSTRIGGGKQGK
jgi:hypothetical protein